MNRAYSAYRAEMDFRVKQYRRHQKPWEIQMEYMPEEQCRAVSPPPEEDYCTLLYGHKGPCSWRKTGR